VNRIHNPFDAPAKTRLIESGNNLITVTDFPKYQAILKLDQPDLPDYEMKPLRMDCITG
jgi:hypothetical protein